MNSKKVNTTKKRKTRLDQQTNLSLSGIIAGTDSQNRTPLSSVIGYHEISAIDNRQKVDDYSDKQQQQWDDSSPLLEIDYKNIGSNGLIKINDLINHDFLDISNYRTIINHQQQSSATKNDLVQNQSIDRELPTFDGRASLPHQYNTISFPSNPVKQTAKTQVQSREHSVASGTLERSNNKRKTLGIKSRSQMNLHGKQARELQSYERPLKRGASYSQIQGCSPNRDDNNGIQSTAIATSANEYEKKILRKYNLSPHHQHVQSKYKNTKPAVDKLRQIANEKKQNMQRQRIRFKETRCPDITSPKEYELINIEIKQCEDENEQQEQLTNQQVQSPVLKSDNESHDIFGKQTNKLGEQATNRLFQDAEKRQKKLEQLMEQTLKDLPNSISKKNQVASKNNTQLNMQIEDNQLRVIYNQPQVMDDQPQVNDQVKEQQIQPRQISHRRQRSQRQQTQKSKVSINLQNTNNNYYDIVNQLTNNEITPTNQEYRTIEYNTSTAEMLYSEPDIIQKVGTSEPSAPVASTPPTEEQLRRQQQEFNDHVLGYFDRALKVQEELLQQMKIQNSARIASDQPNMQSLD